MQSRKQSRGFILKSRDHPGVAGYSGNVVVAGGAIGREKLKAVEVYDASTGEWSRKKDLKGRISGTNFTNVQVLMNVICNT